MTIPETIKKLANDIRTKIYGREVREALAQGIEEAGDIADQAYQITQNLLDDSFDQGLLNTEIEQRMEALYNTKGQMMDDLYEEKKQELESLYENEKAELDNLQQDYANRAENLEATYAPRLTSIETEIEDARGSEPNLNGRLNKFSSQLAQNAQDLNTSKSLIEKPYKENMIYNTNFQNADNWSFKMTDGATTTWTIANNKLNTPVGILTDSVAMIKPFKPADYRMSCTITGTFTNWFGLAIRINDIPTKPEGIAVLFFPNNSTASLWKFTNNNFAKLGTDLSISRADITLSKGITVEIEVIGDKVKLFVNDSLIGTLTHNELRLWKNGYCGLISSKDNAISYSDFNIFEKLYNTIELYKVDKVIAIGSSITNGFGATTGWRVRFQQKISALLNKTVTVVNGGVNGSNTSDMLTRLPTLILSNTDTDICFVEASINDCKITGNVPISTTIQNLRAMIRMCKENGIIPILMTATPINPNIGGTDWSNDSWQQIREMNNLVRRLAFEENIKCVDNAFAFGRYPYAEKIAMIPDGLHPNDDGSEVMATAALETIIS